MKKVYKGLKKKKGLNKGTKQCSQKKKAGDKKRKKKKKKKKGPWAFNRLTLA